MSHSAAKVLVSVRVITILPEDLQFFFCWITSDENNNFDENNFFNSFDLFDFDPLYSKSCEINQITVKTITTSALCLQPIPSLVVENP